MDAVLVWKPTLLEVGTWPRQASERERYTIPTIPAVRVASSAGAVQRAML